jgi:serine/threonine protein kinase
VKDEIGSGSYGTVRWLDFNGVKYVGKRPWTRDDLLDLLLPPSNDVNDGGGAYAADREKRCRAYFDAETHCLGKLLPHPCLPKFCGIVQSTSSSTSTSTSSPSGKHSWMLLEPIRDNSNELARSLQSWLEQEQRDRRQQITAAMPTNGSSWRDHHPSCLAVALGLSPQACLTAVLDVIMRDTLAGLAHIHSHNIVHRDVKPGNLLVVDPSRNFPQREPQQRSGNDHQDWTVPPSRLVFIDFGSAADLDTVGLLKRNVGISSERVAVSPVYSAPEVFIDASRPQEALTFDCFSAGLLFCQLLFQLYDERADAGFHQQLAASEFDLDAWLRASLQSKVTPAGLDGALTVLQERPGLWSLLRRLLQKRPDRRIRSADALRELQTIQQLQVIDPSVDGAFLRDVLDSMETCEVEGLVDEPVILTSLQSSTSPPKSRSLHYVATFLRSRPLGLILSEAEGVDEDEIDLDMSIEDSVRWMHAATTALPGEVFVKGLVEGGQAEEMGVFEVGDRLQGVGELPVGRGGFEKAVNMVSELLTPRTQHPERISTSVTVSFGDRSQSSVR